MSPPPHIKDVTETIARMINRKKGNEWKQFS